MAKLLSQGAEAKIYKTDFIIKHRTKKSYRHPQLDKKIRERRTKSEAKLLQKAHELGINVPLPFIQQQADLSRIKMPFINGDKLSQTLNNYPESKQFQIMKLVGEQTAKLHQNDIIHGDLTTSNMILSPQPTPKDQDITKSDEVANQKINERSLTKSPTGELFLIDFGLGFVSTKLEDKAVDIHLIKQALEAKHFQNHEELFKNFLKGYKWDGTKKVLERLKVIEKRGRYRH